jgi:hypothetical protein
MNDELGLGHRLLDRMNGPAGELRKLDIPTLKKVALQMGDKKLVAMMDDAVVDGFGTVDIFSTAVKFARRAAIKAADNAQANPEWSNPGSSEAAPRGSGPAPTPPAAAGRIGPDRGNADVNETVFTGGVHNPALAVRLIQAIIDNQRRAIGRR